MCPDVWYIVLVVSARGHMRQPMGCTDRRASLGGFVVSWASVARVLEYQKGFNCCAGVGPPPGVNSSMRLRYEHLYYWIEVRRMHVLLSV